MKAAFADQAAWTNAKSAFSAFLAQRAGAAGPPVLRTQTGMMDQELIEADLDGLPVRLVRDRGSIFVDVRVADHWRGARLLLNIADGCPADSSFAQDVSSHDVWARWPDVVKAATDHAGVERFAAEANIAAIARLNMLASEYSAVTSDTASKKRSSAA